MSTLKTYKSQKREKKVRTLPQGRLGGALSGFPTTKPSGGCKGRGGRQEQ